MLGQADGVGGANYPGTVLRESLRYLLGGRVNKAIRPSASVQVYPGIFIVVLTCTFCPTSTGSRPARYSSQA